jgi:hypothetical protein
MGLDVDVVAGSSPQSVELYVPGYFVDTAEARDLGWVLQEWTTLGAAERVVQGLTTGTVAILVLGMLAGLVSAAAIQVVQAAGRRREIAVLVATGWSQRDVSVWIMSEATLAAAAVVALGLIAWIVAGGGTIPGAAAVSVATTLLIAPALALRASRTGSTSGVAVVSGDLNERAPHSPAVRGPATLGLRNALSRPLRALVMVLALAGTAAALALVATVVAEAADRAGPTRLAWAVSQVIQPSLVLTLAGVALANTAALTAMWRLDSRSRSGEAAAFVAVGWSRRQILISRAAAGIVIAVPAAVIGAILTIGGMTAVSGANPVLATVSTVLLALFLGVVGPRVAGVSVDPAQRP